MVIMMMVLQAEVVELTRVKALGEGWPRGAYWVGRLYLHTHTMPALQPAASSAKLWCPA